MKTTRFLRKGIRVKNLTGRALWPIAVLLFLTSTAWASLATNAVRLTVDVKASVRGVEYPDDTAVSIGANAAGVFFSGSSAGLPERVGLDALLVYSNKIIFSTDVDFEKDGTVYADEDLVAYDANAGTITRFLDGSAIGIPPRADINAACFVGTGTNLYFSLDVTANLPGAGVVDDEDVIQYDWTNLTKRFDGTADLRIPPAADLNALYLEGGTENALYFSLDTTQTMGVGNKTGPDEALWAHYISGGFTLLLATNEQVAGRADLVSLDYPKDTDNDWLTDFEEVSGIDEEASTIPGSAIMLSPDGNISNPEIADTDSDGLTDGQEAACGTNPTNDTDCLKIVSITVEDATNNVVRWLSADEKYYALDSTELLSEGFTNEVAGNIGAASGTNQTSYTNHNAGDKLFYRIRLEPQ